MNGFKANKNLGQHFLTDKGIIEQLVVLIAPKEGQSIVEIGPGLGALTLPVLRECKQMTVIEFDRRVIAPLKAASAGVGELNIISADVLRVDFSDIKAPLPLRVIGNLPYNISSPILFHCLKQWHLIQDMNFMLQKEVVERIVAVPGTKAYGRLSIMAQLYCEAEFLLEIAARAFEPPPKVESAMVRLMPRSQPVWPIADFALFENLVCRAFQQRRKMIRKSLRNYFSEEVFLKLEVDPMARPEVLSGEVFARLANYLYQVRSGN